MMESIIVESPKFTDAKAERIYAAAKLVAQVLEVYRKSDRLEAGIALQSRAFESLDHMNKILAES